MYSGSHKYGRGGGGGNHRGGGGAKRNSFPPPPPPHRPPPTTPAGRLSLGGSRSRTPSSAPPPPPASNSAEESFRVVSTPDEPLSFASLIRLAPDLVDEIRRVETQGGAARIKFDSNPNNPGNVIDVGGKEFRFTWSKEMGDCDIYEERQSGEDGSGLLVESGLTCRKLNIQRVLDESIKKQVKMRSEECRQTRESRKAIVLEPGNPSMKSQMKALAAAEVTWKPKQNKDFQFKKKNNEPSQVGGLPKPLYRPVSSSTTTAKGRHSTSPLASPRNQSLASPSVRGSASESQFIKEDQTNIQARAKEKAAGSEKDFPSGVSGQTQEGVVHKDNQQEEALNLQQLLVTLLKENPKGLSLKALEKAVRNRTNSACKIEPILKKIATYEHPGRYILKPGVELEDLASSPEDNHQKQYLPEDSHGGVPAPHSGFTEKPTNEVTEKQVQLANKSGEPNLDENLDLPLHLSDLFGDDETPDHNEGQAARSSDSESDSDSDSGTDSASRSRSRSPAGSASASSSDSEADSSSNSKEASDVDVDIMSDDEKVPDKLQASGHELSSTPVPWSMPEARSGQDGYASEEVDIENDFLDDNEAQLATGPHGLGVSDERLRSVSPDHDKRQSYGVTDFVNEPEDFGDEHPDGLLNSNGKFKRGSNLIQSEENTDNVKRFKGSTTNQSSMPGHMRSQTLQSPPKFSDIRTEDKHDNHKMQMSNRFNRNDNANGNSGMDRGYNYLVPGNSTVESFQSIHKHPARGHNIQIADKSVKDPLNFAQDTKYQEMDAHILEGNPKQGEKGYRGAHDEEDSSNDKGNGALKKSSIGQRNMLSESDYKIQSQRGKKSHSFNTSSRQYMGSSPRDSGKAQMGRSPIDRRRLQRELSDLELGELREPLPVEPELKKRQFERVESFKQSQTLGTSGSRIEELKGKPANQPTLDPGNASSPTSREVAPGKTDSSFKRRSPEPHAEDVIQPHMGVQSQQQRISLGDVGSLSNKAVDLKRLERNDAVANQGTDVEGYGETQKKSSQSKKREDSRKELRSRKGKGSRSRKSNTVGDAGDKRRDASVVEGRKEKRKRNESSEKSTSYSKYDKEEPELKGPIKIVSQYNEYKEEFLEKYESYCSLYKILENHRNEFQRLGMDLDSAKGRDMERYYSILAQMRESYNQCVPQQKRLKKIFVVLHEELKNLKQRMKEFATDYI